MRWRKATEPVIAAWLQADEGAPDRRRQAPRRRSRSVGQVCRGAEPEPQPPPRPSPQPAPEQKVVAQPQPRPEAKVEPPKAAAPAPPSRYAGRQTSAGGRVAAEGARYSAVAITWQLDTAKRRYLAVAHPTHPLSDATKQSLRQRIAGHQLIGMRPTRQRLDAVEPGADASCSSRRCRSRIRPAGSRDS